MVPFVGLVTGDRVSLRAGPGRSYEILSALPKGSKVHVTGEKGPWYSIRLPTEVPAYLHKGFVIPTEEGWAQVRGERVHVRVSGSTAATSWGTLSAPQRVRVLGRQGDWLKIQPPVFCRGWVHRDYIAFLQSEDSFTEEGVSDGQH